MTQRALDLFGDDALPGDTEALIGRFKEAYRKGSKAPSTIAAEVSQLRSAARDAKTHLGMALADLLDRPEEAAELIELAGRACGRSTVLTRSRALQRLAMLHLDEGEGRSWVRVFRNALPKTKSSGWHDSGLSLPGAGSRARPLSPTPDPDALEAILRLATSRSLVDGAIAGLACFSGLELDEICELRWADLTWRDDSDATFCEVGVHRRGRRTTCPDCPDRRKTSVQLGPHVRPAARQLRVPWSQGWRAPLKDRHAGPSQASVRGCWLARTESDPAHGCICAVAARARLRRSFHQAQSRPAPRGHDRSLDQEP